MILLEWFVPGTCVLLHPPGDTTVFERHLLKGIVNISVTYFTNSRPLIILTADAWCNNTLQNRLGDSVFRDIHAVTIWPLLTFSTNCCAPVTGKTAAKHDAVILLLNEDNTSYEDIVLQRMLRKLVTCSFWNPRARYVIASTAVPTSTHGQHAVAVSILNHFYALSILNAIFLIQEPVQRNNSEISSEPLAIDIFTLPQHGPQKSGNRILDVAFLDRWVSEEGRTGSGFRNNVSLFRSQPITDMRGSNVTMAYFVWPPLVMSSDMTGSAISKLCNEGLELRLLKTVAEHTNVTFDFRKKKFNVKAHGYFGAQWLETERLDSFDATWTHFTGAVTWFVPRERAIPRWQSLIKIFNPGFWLLVFFIYVLGSLTFWVLGNTQSRDKETASFRHVILIFMNTLSMALSESVYKKPKRIRSQIFFLLWSLYCFEVNNAYQSSLIGFLTNPGHLPRINDIDSLLESGVELGIQSGIQSDLKDASDPRNKRILKSYITCSGINLDKCLKRMAYEGDLAVAGGRIGLEFLAHTKYMKNGKPLYVPFKDNIQQGHMVIYLKKGSILLERINSIVLRLQNAGIIDKWVNDIRRKFAKHFDDALFEDGFCVLTLGHLEGAFYLLLLGMFVSVTIWLLEIIHHFFGQRFRKERKLLAT
jgi:hypothetical protein